MTRSPSSSSRPRRLSPAKPPRAGSGAVLDKAGSGFLGRHHWRPLFVAVDEPLGSSVGWEYLELVFVAQGYASGSWDVVCVPREERAIIRGDQMVGVFRFDMLPAKYSFEEHQIAIERIWSGSRMVYSCFK